VNSFIIHLSLSFIIAAEWRPFVVEKDPETKEKKKVTLKAFVATNFQRIEELIKNNGGNYIAGPELSWADLSVAHYVETLEKTVDPDIFKSYPNLLKLKETVFQLPQIKKWVAERPEFNMA